MLLQNYLRSYQGLKSENTLTRLALLVLSGVVAAEGCALMTRQTIVAVTPFTLASDAQITKSAASKSYVEAWGLALAELFGNVTPSNVGFIKERIAPLLSPKIYHQAMDAIEANAAQLRNDRVATRFEPRRVLFEKSSGRVFVFGESFVRMANSLEKETHSPRTFEFEIRISNYAPRIHFIDNYEGNPHTVEKTLQENRRDAASARKEQKQRLESKFKRSPQANLNEQEPSAAKLEEGKK